MAERIINTNRRKFLVGAFGLVGLTGLISSALYVFNRKSDNSKLLEKISKEIDVNRWLEEFPTQISGAGEVRKYKTEGARHCLVHVLQIHSMLREDLKTIFPNLREEDLDKLAEDMKESSVQKDIYSILSHLIDKYSLREVYLDGLKVNAGPSLSQTRKSMKRFLKARAGDNEQYRKEYEEDLKICHEFIDFIEKKYEATGKLFIEGRINIKGTELLNDNELAKIIRDLIKRKVGREALDDREDPVLELIVKNKDIRAVVVYGAKHAWGGKQSFGYAYSLEGRESYKDNIYEWNLKNPDKKFSLIEVIPGSFRLSE